MKLAVVGGGSTYTPELVDGIARLRSVLDVEELALVDPAVDRLELVGQLGRRMFAREGHPGVVTWTDDLTAGLADADVVLLQLRVGGQQARRVDETLPLASGCVGQETTGVGGLAKALRTVPVVLDVAERIRRHAAPNAWIVDFTNPVGIVTRALLDAGHRAVGLCNVAIGFQRRFAAHLGVEPARLRLDHVGLNHLTWVRAVHLDGQDVLPRLLDDHLDAIAADLGLPASAIAALGMVPSYYLRYYYAHDEVLAEQRSSRPRADVVAEVERDLLEQYADPARDTKPEQLRARGGAFYSEAAVDLVASLATDRGDIQVVNVRNGGLFGNLADDAVIEVPATISANGPVPARTAPLEPLLAGLVAHVSAYEELALDAARRGGRDRVARALLAHPLVGQVRLAERLADELIAANRDHLPWT
jgi:6-phospho-beta-glucosidase